MSSPSSSTPVALQCAAVSKEGNSRLVVVLAPVVIVLPLLIYGNRQFTTGTGLASGTLILVLTSAEPFEASRPTCKQHREHYVRYILKRSPVALDNGHERINPGRQFSDR